MTNNAVLQPIETIYKGYRFRSRLEARWAVFLDALGIKWQYEPDGFDIDGRKYLPDFWLPQLNSFVELKPTLEACRSAEPLLRSLVAKTGKTALLIAGAPNLYDPYTVLEVYSDHGDVFAGTASWIQCENCGTLRCTCAESINCTCTTSSLVKIIHRYDEDFTRGIPPIVKHALGEAQRARFEHGETGKPHAYLDTLPDLGVYVAGSVLKDDKDEGGFEMPIVCDWRSDICKGINKCGINVGELIDTRFVYAGPTTLLCHGCSYEGLPVAQSCMREVENADAIFAWIDCADTLGTVAEIGAAYMLRKPIFVAFLNEDISTQFYFIRDLATVAIIAPNAAIAWMFFKNWQNQ